MQTIGRTRTPEAPGPVDDGGRALGLRLADHEQAALADAYAAYSSSLLTYLTRMVGAVDAEDVLQRTFLDAWRHADSYDPQHRFAGWLFTIARNRAVDTLRARRAHVGLEAAGDLVGEDGRETVERIALAADVRRALAGLPPHERDAVRLTYFEQLQQTEIAERLGVPVGTVKARVSRGMRRLADLLERDLVLCA